MIEWRDEGIVLRVRPHGETSVIAELFTAAHGRHVGVVRGGVGRRLRPVLQPGNRISATWRARLDEHIGAFMVEPVASSAGLMQDRAALAGLAAVTGLIAFALPERDPHPELYGRTLALLGRLEHAGWPGDYLRWEVNLLGELGYGLNLETCAVTGGTEDLAFVSPRTGRAVSRAAAGQWEERLLPLTPVMISGGYAALGEVLEGLRTTGYFLEKLAAELGNRALPAARERLVAALERGGF